MNLFTIWALRTSFIAIALWMAQLHWVGIIIGAGMLTLVTPPEQD